MCGTIAFANHSLANGGAERVISLLSSSFVRSGYRTLLICNIHSDWEYPIDDRVERFFLNDGTSGVRRLAAIQRIYRLRQICKKEKVDVLVGFMSMSEYSVYATIGLRTKNIISIRNAPDLLYPKFLQKIYARTLLSFSNGAVFQTEEAKNWFPKVLRNKSTIIFNPIGKQFFEKGRNPIPHLLVAIGRLHPQKNYLMMLSALKMVRDNYDDVHLEICGVGKMEKTLKEYVESHQLSDVIKFCGQVNDVPSALARADIFLLSSLFEGMPNSLMEAMVMGVPCIATDSPCGGSKMLLGNDERGLVVPVKDTKAFAKAIISLLENEERKNQLGIAAKEYTSRFSLEQVFHLWENYNMKFLN